MTRAQLLVGAGIAGVLVILFALFLLLTGDSRDTDTGNAPNAAPSSTAPTQAAPTSSPSSPVIPGSGTGSTQVLSGKVSKPAVPGSSNTSNTSSSSGNSSNPGSSNPGGGAPARNGTFSISGGAGGLYPGVQKELVLTVNNPNDYDIKVTSLNVAAGDASGCPATNLQVTNWSGSLVVPAHQQRSATTQIMMAQSAPDSCQGANFPLTYTGTATEP